MIKKLILLLLLCLLPAIASGQSRSFSTAQIAYLKTIFFGLKSSIPSDQLTGQLPESVIPTYLLRETTQFGDNGTVKGLFNTLYFNELDPAFSGSPAKGITQSDINSWNSCKAWYKNFEELRNYVYSLEINSSASAWSGHPATNNVNLAGWEITNGTIRVDHRLNVIFTGDDGTSPIIDGQLLTNGLYGPAPTVDSQYATKAYVDSGAATIVGWTTCRTNEFADSRAEILCFNQGILTGMYWRAGFTYVFPVCL